jgi:hypothetical protein
MICWCFYFAVRVIRSKATYFAQALHKAMKGLGTDDDTLVRIVASRCEVDMVQIKEEFQRNFKQTLYDFIVVCYTFSIQFNSIQFHSNTGQDSTLGKAMGFGPKGTGFDPHLDHKRCSA